MIVANYVVVIFAFGIRLGPYLVVTSANEHDTLMVSLIKSFVVTLWSNQTRPCASPVQFFFVPRADLPLITQFLCGHLPQEREQRRYQNRRHDTLRAGRMIRGERELRPKKGGKNGRKKGGKNGKKKKGEKKFIKKDETNCNDDGCPTSGICFMLYQLAGKN